MYATTARSRPRGSAPSRPRRPAGCRELADQVDGQKVGQGPGGEPPPGAAGRELGVHRPNRRPEVGQAQGVERRDRQPRRVEVERLGGDPRDQAWLQEDVFD
jgi:hypothetical protein